MPESAAVKKRLTVPEKITAFFVERNNEPASFYALMHLASIDTLSKHVVRMRDEERKLVQIDQEPMSILRLSNWYYEQQ